LSPPPVTLADLVEAQVARSPSAVAVVGAGRSLTYVELDSRANRLARHLQALGVGPDARVATCLRRSPEMAVALLGVLKAGGACVPLDPTYPHDRLAAMLADAGVAAVVTEEALGHRLPAVDAPVVILDAGWPDVAGQAPSAPHRRVAAENLAYVLYTSGSTGEPKGVMLTYAGLVEHSQAVSALFELTDGDRVLQFCSISFDVSVEELFPTWASGGTVVLRPDDAPLLGRSWLAWLRRQEVTVVNLPTAYWHEWVRDLEALGEQVPASIRLTIVGGERVLGTAFRTWLDVGGDKIRWLNGYGPAEASVTATVFDARGGFDGDPPIGRAVAGATIHVLDDDGRPVAPGDEGELYIGGPGVARGYLNRPELTAAAFVPDPFGTRAGARLYRTGDVVRELAAGDLEFVGRRDHQVKIRGYRVEPDAVAAELSRHPAVTEAVVVARDDGPGGRRLVGYVVTPATSVPAGELRTFLADRLPVHMVPSAFVSLASLPQTPNGKVDHHALPVPSGARPDLDTAWVAPRTPVEQALTAIWTQVLGIDDVGIDDDFFALGGHSLLATQVVSQAREAFGRDLALQAIFESPTVRGLADALAAAPASVRGAADANGNDGPGTGARVPALIAHPRRPGDRAPLSLAQAQMLDLQLAADPPGLFNVTAQHRFSTPAAAGTVSEALDVLVARHETLRSRVVVEDGTAWQVTEAPAPVPLAVHDLSAVGPDDVEAALRQRVAEVDAVPFDLATAPLLRAHLFDLGDQGSELAVTFDHLICDMTSAYIFLDELTTVYEALVAGRRPELRPVAVQYADFSIWQRAWLTDDRLAAQYEYWRTKLAGMPMGSAVPFDHVPDRPTRRIGHRSFAVSAATCRPLRTLARSSRATPFVVCVAAVDALLSRAGGVSDVVLSTTLSGRQRNELEGVMGMFAGMARIRTDLSGDPTFTEIVRRARETAIGLFDHQDIPFMRVRKALFPDFPAQRSPVATAQAIPVEFLYFHAAHDHWAPGSAVVERPGADTGADRLFVRGQLHPLSITVLDDGEQLWGELSYKLDFYDQSTVEALTEGLERLLPAVGANPELRLSELPVPELLRR
jgi:amino acid adenylation domain-containing protein